MDGGGVGGEAGRFGDGAFGIVEGVTLLDGGCVACIVCWEDCCYCGGDCGGWLDAEVREAESCGSTLCFGQCDHFCDYGEERGNGCDCGL